MAECIWVQARQSASANCILQDEKSGSVREAFSAGPGALMTKQYVCAGLITLLQSTGERNAKTGSENETKILAEVFVGKQLKTCYYLE